MADYIRLTAAGSGPDGLFVAPTRPEPVPSVLVTTAIGGINGYIERVIERLAGEGYAVLALDYYARTGEKPDLSTPEKVMAAVDALSDPQVLADMRAGADWLRGRSETSDAVAALGFCIGGAYSLLASADNDDLACAISFYGMLRYPKITDRKPVSPLDGAASAKCPILGHFGEEDHLVPLGDALALREATRGSAAEIYTYPGAGHAFHEDFRPAVHRPAAAREAWDRTLAYLRYYLASEFVRA